MRARSCAVATQASVVVIMPELGMIRVTALGDLYGRPLRTVGSGRSLLLATKIGESSKPGQSQRKLTAERSTYGCSVTYTIAGLS